MFDIYKHVCGCVYTLMYMCVVVERTVTQKPREPCVLWWPLCLMFPVFPQWRGAEPRLLHTGQHSTSEPCPHSQWFPMHVCEFLFLSEQDNRVTVSASSGLEIKCKVSPMCVALFVGGQWGSGAEPVSFSQCWVLNYWLPGGVLGSALSSASAGDILLPTYLFYKEWMRWGRSTASFSTKHERKQGEGWGLSSF